MFKEIKIWLMKRDDTVIEKFAQLTLISSLAIILFTFYEPVSTSGLILKLEVVIWLAYISFLAILNISLTGLLDTGKILRPIRSWAQNSERNLKRWIGWFFFFCSILIFNIIVIVFGLILVILLLVPYLIQVLSSIDITSLSIKTLSITVTAFVLLLGGKYLIDLVGTGFRIEYRKHFPVPEENQE